MAFEPIHSQPWGGDVLATLLSHIQRQGAIEKQQGLMTLIEGMQQLGGGIGKGMMLKQERQREDVRTKDARDYAERQRRMDLATTGARERRREGMAEVRHRQGLNASRKQFLESQMSGIAEAITRARQEGGDVSALEAQRDYFGKALESLGGPAAGASPFAPTGAVTPEQQKRAAEELAASTIQKKSTPQAGWDFSRGPLGMGKQAPAPPAQMAPARKAPQDIYATGAIARMAQKSPNSAMQMRRTWLSKVLSEPSIRQAITGKSRPGATVLDANNAFYAKILDDIVNSPNVTREEMKGVAKRLLADDKAVEQYFPELVKRKETIPLPVGALDPRGASKEIERRTGGRIPFISYGPSSKVELTGAAAARAFPLLEISDDFVDAVYDAMGRP